MTPTTIDSAHLQAEALNAFIDGELPTSESLRIEQHVAACHGCALRVLAAMQLKTVTARAGERFAPSPEALARLTAQLCPQVAKETTVMAPIRRRSFRPAAVWSALAAALVLAVALIGWRQIHQTNMLTAELLDQHLAALSSGATPQIISTDRHTVKPWFQGRLPFSFNLPEAAALPPDTTLRGADLVYLEGQPAALLIFTIHKHQASVFITQRGSGLAITPRSVRSGFAVRSTTAAELRLIAVSDVNPAELDALVGAVAKVQ